MARTFSLFETLCQESTLFQAWKRVKAKKSGGGIDGISIESFDENAVEYVRELSAELKTQKWKPQPYMGISIPKKKGGRRQLGLLSIKDKIVQQALKYLIEPRIENVFLNNSYGYRPDRGHTKAVRRTFAECQNKSNQWILKLDIDDFFDTVDHDILFKRLKAVISDPEIVRLVELCVKMGRVTTGKKWEDITSGVPQGAVLSPLMANLYLNSFDQFITSKTNSYVRYADDFVIFCQTRELAVELLERGMEYLSDKLKLKLNAPFITEISKGVEFLGLFITPEKITLSEAKRQDILDKIDSISLLDGTFTEGSFKSWKGIQIYYAPLLSQPELNEFDEALKRRFTDLVSQNVEMFRTKDSVISALHNFEFLSDSARNSADEFYGNVAKVYQDIRKNKDSEEDAKHLNRQIIQQRKLEYRRKEAECSELIITTPGSYIGLTNKGLSIKNGGKCIHKSRLKTLKHITVVSSGVSISSNALNYCMSERIPVDFFDARGKHYASVLSPNYIESTLWSLQMSMDETKKQDLAKAILSGKIKNQHNLMKYYNKYHKSDESAEKSSFEKSSDVIKDLLKDMDSLSEENWQEKLVGIEAQAALAYWDYVRFLLSDDDIDFEERERKGAKDLFNSMLNYGYAILYVRVWEALLGVGLNPYASVIHVRQDGKPTFVYDVVEIFRAQAVDRVVIGLVQKDMSLKVEDGRLDDNTRKLLVRSILERLQRYENYRGEEMTLERIIQRQAYEIAQYVSENQSFRPYLAKW